MVVLGNKVKGRNLTNEFLVSRIKAGGVEGEKDLGLLVGEQCSAVVGAIRYKSSFRYASLWAFHFYPPALRRNIFFHLLSKRKLL